MTDIQQKLILIRTRQLVAQLCREARHGRWWFYRVLKGEASILDELALVDKLLSTPPSNPIALLREEYSVAHNQAIDQAELARLLGVSRQTISRWEAQSDTPIDRVTRVRKALVKALGVSQ